MGEFPPRRGCCHSKLATLPNPTRAGWENSHPVEVVVTTRLPDKEMFTPRWENSHPVEVVVTAGAVSPLRCRPLSFPPRAVPRSCIPEGASGGRVSRLQSGNSPTCEGFQGGRIPTWTGSIR